MKERKPTVSMRAAQEHRRRERVAWQAGYDKAVADMLEHNDHDDYLASCPPKERAEESN